jgi:hypothetical protein
MQPAAVNPRHGSYDQNQGFMAQRRYIANKRLSVS